MEELTLTEKILEAIKSRNQSELKEIFLTIPTIDIAEALDEVQDVKIFLYIFRVVSSELTSEFFAELSVDKQELIVNAFTDKQLITLLEESYADDIADTLEELPANVATRVLRVAPSELRKQVNQLLNYKENTAGSLMTTEYIELKSQMTVADAIAFIRKKGRDAETVYTIFIRDAKRTLVGTASLDDLIFAGQEETLETIMDRDFVTCNVNDDQEDVANMFKRYDLTAMAVVSNENKMLGIITIDDIVDIIVEEATEDIAHMNQITNMEEPYLKTPVFKIFLKCIPWLIALMILQVFSTMILSNFQSAIESVAVLAVFTPLIMDAGGNSGGQTSTMIVRSLSLEEFDKKDIGKVFWKEVRVALCIASAVAIFSFMWLMLEMAIGIVQINPDYAPNLDINLFKLIIAGLVSSTLFITMLISRLVGCSLPFLAKLLHLDPAVMCGPLTTTIVDIISLITYFVIWTQIVSPVIGL